MITGRVKIFQEQIYFIMRDNTKRPETKKALQIKTKVNKKANNRKFFSCVRLGRDEPTGCPSAWWSRAWRGWRRDWCPRRRRRGRPRKPPGGPWRRRTGTSTRSCSPGRSHGPDVGREPCGGGVPSTSGNAGSHGGRRYPDGNGGASWHHLQVVLTSLITKVKLTIRSRYIRNLGLIKVEYKIKR